MSRRRVSKWSKHEHEHRVASLRVALEGKGKVEVSIFFYTNGIKKEVKKRGVCATPNNAKLLNSPDGFRSHGLRIISHNHHQDVPREESKDR